jgi:hypothetical protein
MIHPFELIKDVKEYRTSLAGYFSKIMSVRVGYCAWACKSVLKQVYTVETGMTPLHG